MSSEPHNDQRGRRVRSNFSAFGNNFAQLLLSMYLSHCMLGSPFYGAAFFLFVDIWTVYYTSGAHYVSSRRGLQSMIFIALSSSLIAASALIYALPSVLQNPKLTPLTLYICLIALRNVGSVVLGDHFKRRGKGGYIYKVLFQLLALLPCLWLDNHLTPEQFRITWIGLIVTGTMLTFSPSGVIHRQQLRGVHKMQGIHSYLVFSSTGFYAQTAFCLGVFMYMCYICFGPTGSLTLRYSAIALWLVAVVFIFWLFRQLQGRLHIRGGFNTFMVGALMWIVGTVALFSAVGTLSSLLWLVVWGMGIAATNAVLLNLEESFVAVAALDDKSVERGELQMRGHLSRGIAYIFSASIMLLVLTLWCFVIPDVENREIPSMVRRTMMFLPVLFIGLSLFFALRQPLDVANRDKLNNFLDAEMENEHTRENLKKLLIEKYRTRFGVKILMLMVRPLLHLKVYGKEKIDAGHFPSIFVCNHGIFYGPISAVIYLPTYFRPWIDRKMLSREEAAREMYGRFVYRLPLLSEKCKMRVARALARPVVWGLNSCNPIPVERDNLRNVMSTFHLTIDSLREGDNVLLFPERPHKATLGDRQTVVHETDTVGEMFTGFANIGKMYHDATGKSLRFYPIYTDKRRHTLRIGDPITYDPSTPHKEEKERIAHDLREAMLALRGMSE